MVRKLKKSRWKKAISYQDTAVHKGTIYKAAGWKIENVNSGSGHQWVAKEKPGAFRKSGNEGEKSPKVRWGISLQNA